MYIVYWKKDRNIAWEYMEAKNKDDALRMVYSLVDTMYIVQIKYKESKK